MEGSARAYLGIGAGTVPVPRRIALRLGLAQATGAVVSAVDAESPADHAGLLTGDILLAVDGVPVTGADDLVRLLDAEKINRTIPLERRYRARIHHHAQLARKASSLPSLMLTAFATWVGGATQAQALHMINAILPPRTAG
jgi:predicted metalloprotease with PDZ domain